MENIFTLFEHNPDAIFVIIVFIAFFIILYMNFCKKPKIKVVKAPTHKEILKQHKKERRIRKIKRKLKLPHIGKAKIYKYDKTTPYIDAAWEELKKH